MKESCKSHPIRRCYPDRTIPKRMLRARNLANEMAENPLALSAGAHYTAPISAMRCRAQMAACQEQKLKGYEQTGYARTKPWRIPGEAWTRSMRLLPYH